MRKQWKISAVFLLYIVGLLCSTVQTYAAEDSSTSENPIGFNYKVIKPENQRETNVGYFDLRMTPGQKQTVQVELVNPAAEDVEVEVSLNGAKTNGNGVVEFGPVGIDKDKSLKYDFVDVVKGPESVVIPAKGTVMVDLTITMPEVGYDGVIAGGIQLKKKVDEKEREKQTGVINEYAFMIGMLLTETDTMVLPELELNDIYAGLRNFRNSIFINFSNVEAAFLESATTEVQITEKDSDAVLYDTKKANMRIAPNSMVDFPVSMNGEQMTPGEYHATITVTAGDRKWAWDKDFTITDEEADKFNDQDVSMVKQEGINWMLIGLIGGSGIVVGLIIFFVVRMINKKKQQKKRVAKKKKSTRK